MATDDSNGKVLTRITCLVVTSVWSALLPPSVYKHQFHPHPGGSYLLHTRTTIRGTISNTRTTGTAQATGEIAPDVDASVEPSSGGSTRKYSQKRMTQRWHIFSWSELCTRIAYNHDGKKQSSHIANLRQSRRVGVGGCFLVLPF